MNFASLCAQTTEDPREVYVSATSTAMRCNVLLPPVGNKAPTPIELNVYGKAAERFSRITKNSSMHMVPTSKSGSNEGWMTTSTTIQTFYNNSDEWWKTKFNKYFTEVYVINSIWNDQISYGRWFVCIK